jgi:fluoroquinolone resistance protein
VADRRNEDWYAEDLTGATFADTAFHESDFTETTSTSGAKFTDCTFRGVRFNVSEHTGAAFDNCTFSNCNFFGATFTDCKFVGAMLARCSFDRLVVRGGDWSFAGLAGADLRTSTFEDVRMREADLTGARCDGAVLRRLDLSGAALGKASFERCDLRGSDLSNLDPWSASLTGAIIDIAQAAVIAASMGLDIRAQ